MGTRITITPSRFPVHVDLVVCKKSSLRRDGEIQSITQTEYDKQWSQRIPDTSTHSM